MVTNKPALLWGLGLTLLFSSAGRADQSSPAPAPRPPDISNVDRRFLTQLIRRTLEARLTEQPAYQPGYLPPALNAVECQVVVTLRQDGYARGIGISDCKPVVEACRQAADLAWSSVRAAGPADASWLRDARIEIEALGTAVPCPRTPDTPDGPPPTAGLEPGLDGVRMSLDGTQRWFTPGEMISKNVPLGEALRTLGKELSPSVNAAEEADISRFRSLHWWEVDGQGRTVTLRRGLMVLPPEAVIEPAVREALQRISAHLLYRQQPDGMFACTYDPAADEYAQAGDPVDQAGAAWALAAVADRKGDSASQRASDRVLASLRKALCELPGVEGAAFVGTTDGRNPLALTAQFTLAMMAAPEPDRFATDVRRCVQAMRWLQLPSGKIATAFPPADVLQSQDVVPSQALLALARAYARDPSADLLATFDQALTFYRDYLPKNPSLAAVPGHAQAFALMAELTRRKDFADYVFTMCDWACSRQLTPENCTYPELWGGFVPGSGNLPGAGTAEQVEGLVAAARLARKLGEDDRTSRYTAACRAGTRFILQLQVKPEECYFVRSPRDAQDGIRRNPVNCRLDIADCQHAVLALSGVRELLWAAPP